MSTHLYSVYIYVSLPASIGFWMHTKEFVLSSFVSITRRVGGLMDGSMGVEILSEEVLCLKKLFILGLVMLVFTSIGGSIASADDGQIRITADNFYTLWVNDVLKGSNKAGNDTNPTNWGTPEYYDMKLFELNTILIKAENAGTWSSSNPAALIASVLNKDSNQVIATTDSYWAYSTDYNETTKVGNWYTPSVVLASWNTGIWSTAASYTAPGKELYNAFNTTSAKWIWGASASSSPVWFKLNVTTEGPSVPEPMSMMLGIMGLGSVAGFRRLRRK